MIKTLRSSSHIFKDNFYFILISISLSIPAILLSDWILFILPLIVLITLIYVYQERLLIFIIIITLFTLVGELNQFLRTVVHLIDFSLLGILFLKKYGLNLKLYPKIPKSLIYFLILYCSALLLSAVMSNYPFAGIKLITQQLVFFVIAYVFYALIKDKEDIKLYFVSLTFVAFILVTASLVSIYEGGFSLIELISKNRARVSAIINNIEAATNFYVVSFPFLIGLLLIKTKRTTRYLIWITLFYIVIGLILAMSRSAIIGIVISSAVIFFVLQRRRFYQFLFSIIGILLLFLLYDPLADITYFFFRIEEGLSAREQTWSMAINIIKDHPIFGIGPGAYKYEMFNYFPYMLDDWWGRLFIYYHEVTEGANFSHNFFLTLFSDMGILGLFTAFLVPILFFKIGIETIKTYKYGHIENYYLIVVLFAAGTSIIARNFFNGIGILFYGGVTTDLPFWLIFSSLIYFNYNLSKRLDRSENAILIDEE